MQPTFITHAQDKSTPHVRYQINFALDFDTRTFKGTERVRWINRDSHPASVVYFHLYANVRSADSGTPRTNPFTTNRTDSSGAIDEPHIEVTQVRAALNGMPLAYSLDDQETTMRINLREPVGSGAATEIEIAFKGLVPEIDPDETSLPAHVIQQLGAALRDTRETRRARDINFRSRGVMLLGTAYPVLAVREGNEWQREVRASVGDWIFNEVADYDVRIDAPTDVVLFTSADEYHASNADAQEMHAIRNNVRAFAGENLRSFAFIAGRSLAAGERTVSGVRVRAVWAAEHERTGRRVLDESAEAVRIFIAHFGALPYHLITIAEAPLVAGVGSAEFAGLGIIASAFYVDFDAPSIRNLPDIVREQRASVEDSLEFTAAHMVAHQWWGMTVGSAPERVPVLDEALAHWSALLYYGEAHGAARAAQARDDQLRGVYEIYRTFGGDDMPADRAAREYRNSFQYAAIVSGKGALMFSALEQLLGEEKFFTALRRYHEANRFEIANLDDLRGAFIAEAPVNRRRDVTRTFDRWLTEKHGDEDIAPPNPQLAAALGINTEPVTTKDRNAFLRLGRFFWRQMTRIR